MIWYNNLYLGESVIHKKKRLMRRISKGSLFSDTYVLALAANPENKIDIIATKYIRKKYYPKRNLVIIGLAGDYEEALQLTCQIIMEVYTIQGDFSVREYIKKNWNIEKDGGVLC